MNAGHDTRLAAFSALLSALNTDQGNAACLSPMC
jgi:hypothetical protein